MNVSSLSLLEFPEMLHGQTETIRLEVEAEGNRWAREYLETGAFTQPRQMRQVPPGEVLIMHSVAELELILRPRWRVHMFFSVFMGLDDGLPEEEHPRARAAFEAFCLSTPWGALYHVVSPPPKRSAERMAHRLSALLRFWDVLQALRYAFWLGRQFSLEELVQDIYGVTLAAWCPGGPASVREHLALTVDRMARATREECLEAVLRVVPTLLRENSGLKHKEVLGDTDLLRERLGALPAEEFDRCSSADRFAVNGALFDWDRELRRRTVQ